MNMPLNKFMLYCESAARLQRMERKVMVTDTSAAIGGALSKGVGEYLKLLDEDK